MKKSILFLFLVGCGGGGGSGSDDKPFFGGVYDVQFRPISDTCTRENTVGDFATTWTVNQNGATVVLEDEKSGRVYSGVADSDGFTVTHTVVEPGACERNVSAHVVRTYELHDANGSEETVFFRHWAQCEGSVITCQADWIGTGRKQ